MWRGQRELHQVHGAPNLYFETTSRDEYHARGNLYIRIYIPRNVEVKVDLPGVLERKWLTEVWVGGMDTHMNNDCRSIRNLTITCLAEAQMHLG